MSCVLHCGDNVEVMRREIPDGSIQLTVTSPPYDNLRKYNGYAWDFQAVARELFRVTKPGGVVVWIVADATVNGSETGTSFRQALYFKECGFNLHDTMIYRRERAPLSHNRYEQHFEFMFVLSKDRPSVFNGLREVSKNAGKKRSGSMRQDCSDELSTRNAKGVVATTKLRGNVWDLTCANGGTQDRIANQHPAIFPELLAQDHILSWSNPGDTVLDPFVGSGTSGKMAVLNGRSFVGIDISPDYVALSRARIPGMEEGS